MSAGPFAEPAKVATGPKADVALEMRFRRSGHSSKIDVGTIELGGSHPAAMMNLADLLESYAAAIRAKVARG